MYYRRPAYLRLEVLHRLLKGFGCCPLVVTQDSHSSVGPVVGQDLCWNVFIRWKGVKMAHDIYAHHLRNPPPPIPKCSFHKLKGSFAKQVEACKMEAPAKTCFPLN